VAKPMPEVVPMGEPVHRGFGPLPCPRCGDNEVCISIDLDNFDEEQSLCCAQCEAKFGLGEVRQLIQKWSRVLEWLDTAPVLEEQER
jgi:transcription elongation factor Elf1